MSAQKNLCRFVLSALLGAGPLSGAILSAPFILAGITQAQAASKLGELTSFRNVVADSKALLDTSDLPAAKARLKDLETSWDEAEAGLKPRAAADWHILDKAIDRALTAVRATPPDMAACKSAVDEVVATMDRLAGRSYADGSAKNNRDSSEGDFLFIYFGFYFNFSSINSTKRSSLILLEVHSDVFVFLNCGVSPRKRINCSCAWPVPVTCT